MFRELETYIKNLNLDKDDPRRKETLIHTLHKAHELLHVEYEQAYRPHRG